MNIIKKGVLVVITGPTAVGKTEVSIRLARHYGADIVCADSRQMYKGMDIATAMPSIAQRREVCHHLFSVLELGKRYNVSMYEKDVLSILSKLFEKEKSHIALLCGGSMMYINSVCRGVDCMPEIDLSIRNALNEKLCNEGLDVLLDELYCLDPQYYNLVDKNNHRRVIHALEICRQTGKTFSSFRRNTVKERPFFIIKIALFRPREEIYERINCRCEEMIKQGLEIEAGKFYHLKNLNSLDTLGYKEMFEYIEGKTTLAQAVERMKSNTRRYARKQLTWLRRDKEIKWFSPDDIDSIISYIDAQRSLFFRNFNNK